MADDLALHYHNIKLVAVVELLGMELKESNDKVPLMIVECLFNTEAFKRTIIQA